MAKGGRCQVKRGVRGTLILGVLDVADPVALGAELRALRTEPLGLLKPIVRKC